MNDRPVLAVLIGPFPGPVHGVSVINAKLAERMAAEGLVVERIDLSPGRLSRGPVYHLTRMARTLRGLVRILTGFARRRYIMSVDGGGGLLYNIALALGVRLKGRPLMLYHHSTRYVLADSRLMRVLLVVAGRSTPHVFCSEKMAALFQARYPGQGAAVVVNNAAWIDAGSPGTGSGTGLRLGFLSTLTLEKGLGRAIDTLRLARARGMDTELVLAGAVVDQQAQALLKRAGDEFGARLVYRGVIGGGAKAAFYGALDVFLFPSLYPHETQSLVVPEALAAATPVIAHDHHFVGEVLGQGGLLIPADDGFAERAVAWIAEGQWPARRTAALRQFENEAAEAGGQVDRLIAWTQSGRL